MSTHAVIADAVVAAINTAALGVAASRPMIPTFDLATAGATPVCFVIPRARELSGSGRRSRQADCLIDVGVKKQLAGPTDKAGFDAMLTLVEAIDNALSFATIASATWVRSTNDPVFVVEDLVEKNVFTGILTITYRRID